MSLLDVIVVRIALFNMTLDLFQKGVTLLPSSTIEDVSTNPLQSED